MIIACYIFENSKKPSMSTYVTVQLQVPYGYGPGTPIQAVAPGGIKFKTFIPQGVQPGQIFNVRVPINQARSETPIEIKEAAPSTAAFSLLPSLTIDKDMYYKDILTCSERCCNVSGCIGTWVRFQAHQVRYSHPCTICGPLCSCLCSWDIELDQKSIGSFQAAGCYDNPLFYFCCSCIYCGDLMAHKFMDQNNQLKFTTRRSVKCCQGCLVACSLCLAPCVRCFNYCCTDSVYARFQQDIFGADLNDKTPIAKITYVERMYHPCLPNERMKVTVEPTGSTSLSKEDLALLSFYGFLVSPAASGLEFQLDTCYLGAAEPTGYGYIDEANYITGEFSTREEALSQAMV